MKRKLLLLLLVLVPLLTLAGAFSLRIFGPKMIAVAPPSGRPIGEFDHPRTEASLLAVRIALPVSLVARLANERAPEDFQGSEQRDFHQRIRNGGYAWQARRGEISVENTGAALRFATPFAGAARFQGEVDARIVRIPLDTTAELKGLAAAVVTPEVTPAWEVDPKIIPEVTLSEAAIGLGGIGNLDISGMLGSTIGQYAQNELQKLAPALRKQLSFRNEVEGLWREAYLSQKVSEDPPVWVSVTPSSVLLGPVDYRQADRISLSFAIASETYLTNRDPGMPVPAPLPDLVAHNGPLATELNLPLVVSERELNEVLGEQRFEFETGIGGAIEVSGIEAQVGEAGFLNLKLDLVAKQGGAGRGISGGVWVRGRPMIDIEKQTLGFSEISLTVESQNALSSTAAWLLEGMLVRTLENQLRLDMNDYQAELEEEIHQALAEMDLPPGIEFTLQDLEIQLADIYTVTRHHPEGENDPAIVVVVRAVGGVETLLGDELLSLLPEP